MDPTKDKQLIRNVSRSFSLTLLSVPKPQRAAVTLAYLLARFADTLSDAGKWDTDERLLHLTEWEASILKKDPRSWQLKGSIGSFGEEEVGLITEGEAILKAYTELPKDQQEATEDVLKTLIQGMKWDLAHFRTNGAPVYGVKDESLFDWYTYSIAGCVGSFWVRIFSLPQNLDLLAVSYGKALQRINILRDVVADWKRGRVYFPTEELKKYEIEMGVEPWRSPNWKKFASDYIEKTRSMLIHGGHFCDAISPFQFRLRWASAMPFKIGWATLDRLADSQANWEEPIKIPRSEVKKLALTTLLKTALGASLQKNAQIRS